MLRSSAADAIALADAIREVKERIGLCEICFNLADESRCRICQDGRRDADLRAGAASVVGVDFSERMLERARRKTAAVGSLMATGSPSQACGEALVRSLATIAA